ncbi:PAS domain S-box protein [Halomonas sp. MCCC 1A11036]|uniref:histidine kinase n=1 Tax=Billgrantia zhangzhouensis TaxID=2733481 RepID=A0ABS9A9Y1_9GAMM|nr:PAS domain S-box protein [Halomonas zhangzhouensis]MCE8018722.1 PAS domain S-box protein [Halomonas zhangzhouensis]
MSGHGAPERVGDIQRWQRDALHAAADHHAIISMTDIAGRITYVNDKFCTLSGYRREELLGATHGLIKSGRHSREFYADLWRTIRGGDTWRGEVCNRKKNGEIYWVSATIMPMADEAGQPAGYVSIRSDITLLKQTQEELQENTQRYKFFIDHVEEGIVVCDQGIIVDASERWFELFRCRREDAIGQPVMSFTAPSVVPMALQLIESKWAEPYESVMLRHDGTTFPAIVRGRNQMVGERELRLTTVLDISRQKENEQAVQALKQEAERANQAKTEFLSSMSHELRTPLNAIFGFAQLLEFDESLDGDQQDSVREILKAASHLLGLINELLDLAKIESGHMTLSIEAVLLASVFDECEQLLRPLVSERQISLHMPAASKAAVWADRVRLKQVLINLLSNAIKYNRSQGEVRLTVEGNEGYFRIVVADTGNGIAPEDLAQLFQPFNRLDAEYSKTEGTGIGLVISRRLVEAMEGTIGVDSTLGQGSRFWIDLPQADPETAKLQLSKLPRKIKREDDGQEHVLYIDDNPINLKLVTQMLGKLRNILLVTAHTPELGIELAQSRKPCLILLDINMPRMNGYEVLRTLKADLQLRHVPVIAVSGNAMPQDIERGIAAGFTDYLTKPIDIGRFLESIDRHRLKGEHP